MNGPVRHTTRSEAATRKIAQDLSRHIRRGDVVALFGELGTGKTQFVKGVCEGLGIAMPVSSPTFVLLNRYDGTGEDGRELLVYHFDLYRVERAEEVFDLGYEEYFSGDGVCLVEWADRIADLLPPRRIDVHLQHGLAAEERVIEVRRHQECAGAA